MTLSDFLLARIAEDEERVRMARASFSSLVRPGQPRALAECEAKRRVVGIHTPFDCSNVRCEGGGLHCWTCEEGLAVNGGSAHYPCATLRALTLTYADHPDYRAEWAV